MKSPQPHSRRAALRLRVALWIVPLLLAGVRPASAQFEFAGSWTRVSTALNGGNSTPVDYTGIQLNDEGRSRGLTYSQSRLSMPERQCMGWAPSYLLRGIFAMTVWPEIDPVTGGTLAFTIGGWADRGPITIWMDGRPHPSPYAEHQRAGFATGRWEDNSLVASITHLNANFIEVGPPMSDEATITMRFTRRGSLLMIVAVVDDPIYLAEPYVISAIFENVPQLGWAAGPPCIIADEGVSEGRVPNYLPGKNPFVDEVTQATHIPREAVLGGAETVYPEYRKKIKDEYLRGIGMKR